MGGLVENQLLRATRALFEGDEARARQAIALDAEVDSLEVRVDQKCVRLLALYQPAASDLRFVAAAMKVVTELARNMVSRSIGALARADVALARKVISRDAAVDLLEQETVGTLLAEAGREPELLRSVFRLAHVTRSLERIGDHATNIAEMTLYVADGRLERHAARH